MLDQLPVASIASTLAAVLAILVVVLFFATSSDSGSLVVDIFTNGGDPNPVWQQRLFWAVLEGVVAAVLLVAGAASGEDALSALQTASIVAGLPFCFVLILMAFGLTKGLATENVDTPADPPGRPAGRPARVQQAQRGAAQRGPRRRTARTSPRRGARLLTQAPPCSTTAPPAAHAVGGAVVSATPVTRLKACGCSLRWCHPMTRSRISRSSCGRGRRPVPELRWTTPAQWHLTLAFFGEVAERHLDDLLERLARAASRRTPTELRVAGAGAFPDAARAKVIWAGIDAAGADEELRRMATGARGAGAKSGAGGDGGRFHPHLTLARTGAPARGDALAAGARRLCGTGVAHRPLEPGPVPPG